MRPASDATTFENRAVAVQQDPGPDVPARAQQRDAGAFVARSRGAERQPDLHGVVRDQARNGHGHALGERRLAGKGAHELAARGLEHELQLGETRGDGAVTMQTGPLSFGTPSSQIYGSVMNEV